LGRGEWREADGEAEREGGRGSETERRDNRIWKGEKWGSAR
jgi:hypothetical protein